MKPSAYIWLVAVNLAAYFAVKMAWLLSGSTSATINSIIDVFALSGAWTSALTHPWSLLTYSLLHLSSLHLIVNMLWLIWFGKIASCLISQTAFLFTYASGAIAGALFYLVTSTFCGNATSCLIGASAAILSVIALTAFSAPNLKLQLLGFGTFKLKWVALAAAVMIVASSITAPLTQTMAHIGGIAAGISAAYAVISHRNRMQSEISNRSDYQELLEKIQRSGYNSLTAGERASLFHHTSSNNQPTT